MTERSIGAVQRASNSPRRIGVIGTGSLKDVRGRVALRKVVWSERSDRPADVAADATHKYSIQ